jgi:hypothetical protein
MENVAAESRQKIWRHMTSKLGYIHNHIPAGQKGFKKDIYV